MRRPTGSRRSTREEHSKTTIKMKIIDENRKQDTSSGPINPKGAKMNPYLNNNSAIAKLFSKGYFPV